MSQVYYTEDHEYIRVDGDVGTVGITNYAQEQLGDVVFVELPEVGAEVERGGESGVVESVKVASEIFAPVTGEIVEVNETLGDSPELVNEDPMDKAWFFKIRIADTGELDGMKDEAAYNEYIESLG